MSNDRNYYAPARPGLAAYPSAAAPPAQLREVLPAQPYQGAPPRQASPAQPYQASPAQPYQEAPPSPSLPAQPRQEAPPSPSLPAQPRQEAPPSPSLPAQPRQEAPPPRQKAPPPCTDTWSGRVVYPEVYYKIQPFIIQACMQAETSCMPLNQDLVDRMGDGVYHDVCQVYPELMEYAKCPERGPRRTSYAAMQFGGSGFRRRGMLRDLIDILLLYELFGRRRAY